MTPKEKAKTLINNFYILRGMDWNMAINCSLVAVDEILNVIEDEREGFNWKDYYKEVKQEINRL